MISEFLSGWKEDVVEKDGEIAGKSLRAA